MSDHIKSADKAYIAATYNRSDVEIATGNGAVCYDYDGVSYIDFTSGIGVNSLGFCDNGWVAAVSEQTKTLNHTSNLFYTAPAVKLAKALCDATGYQKAFFCNSGAEANECAIKAVRKHYFDQTFEEKNVIITLKNSFHGRTVTTLSATGQEHFHQFFNPFTKGFVYVEPNQIDEFHYAVNQENVCAVMLELIQGEGGVCPLDLEFVKEVADICDKKGILLIADEIQTGIGRTGSLLCCEQYNIRPNIVTLAKGLGGGLPIGTVLFDIKTSEIFSAGQHGSTFGGNPIVCAGAEYILKTVSKKSFLSEVAAKGEYLKKRLLNIPEVAGVDGMGLMLGVRLKTKKAADVVKTAAQNGLLLLTAKEKLRLLPPLIITHHEIDQGIAILESILNEA